MGHTALCQVTWAGAAVEIEHQWLSARTTGRPLIVFLHEGLGSVSMWRDYPAQLCGALDWNGLVYSRPGYGRSTPRPSHQQWLPDYMHRQANEMLPALLEVLEVRHRYNGVWLFGHSDGGSIALIHAAHHQGTVQGVVAVAPHVMVEDISVTSIREVRNAYLQGNLKARLAKHHTDPDSPFWGWNGVWLSPEFRDWSIENLIPRISCPVLAVQGRDDEYGTLAQLERLTQLSPHAITRVISNCGHSPHREQPNALTSATMDFVAGLNPQAVA